eukprot:CAMPEP_0181481256 /NCGR_PEP_ID=MMETSP1110-20121109/44221_1 /TAXON_ID=174948 /ORGANISM="Symbiodinium sp., Strain CCMP421" /LENGTH=45 /DNA_ID= /DNA_START= /DNA_END= /DNA_ORIENTATION=
MGAMPLFVGATCMPGWTFMSMLPTGQKPAPWQFGKFTSPMLLMFF